MTTWISVVDHLLGIAEHILHVFFEHDGVDVAFRRFVRIRYGARQALAHQFGQHLGVLRLGRSDSASDSRMVRKSRMEISSRSRFLTTFSTLAQAQHGRDQFLHQLGTGFGEHVQQVLEFLAAHQFRGVLTQHFGKMRGDNRGYVHHRVSQHLRFLRKILRNPAAPEAQRPVPTVSTPSISSTTSPGFMAIR